MATKKYREQKKPVVKKSTTGKRKGKKYTGTLQAWERGVHIPLSKDESK